MVGCSVWVHNVEDALARNDEAVAEALAFRGDLTGLAFWVLAFIIACEVTDDVRVLRFRENEERGIMGLEFLNSRCKILQG